jgi:hypothetical protein
LNIQDFFSSVCDSARIFFFSFHWCYIDWHCRGPRTLCAYLTKRSTKSTTVVFTAAVFSSFINVIALLFIIPDSLSQKVRDQNIKAAEDVRATTMQNHAGKTGTWRPIKYAINDFFKPLRLLGPAPRQNGRGSDWSLPLVACAALCYQLTVVSADHLNALAK